MVRRESERQAAATACHVEKEDGTRVKIQDQKCSGPAHTEGDINTSLAFINGDGTLNSADITSPANRTCGQAQGPFRSTRRIAAAMALQKKAKTAKRSRGRPGDYPALHPLERQVILLVQVLANVWESLHVYAYMLLERYFAR